MVSDEKLISILKQYRYRAFGESRDENDNVAQELSDVVGAIEELLQARATLANLAAVREPVKCVHCDGTGVLNGANKCRVCNGTGQRSVEPKTETLAELVGDARGEMADYREAMSEPKPVTCSPITEPSMRHDEEWDGMVVRSPPVAPRPAEALKVLADRVACGPDRVSRRWLMEEFAALSPADAEGPKCEVCGSPFAGSHFGDCRVSENVRPATPPAPQVSPNSSSTSQEVREALAIAADEYELRAGGGPRNNDSPEEIRKNLHIARGLRRLATPSDGPTALTKNSTAEIK